ncbi:helix-turn-helix domain-containing protein [Parendozoicomonas haliclonae]|uniref:Helix-turn-helix protein n=1 Tax=Parendozoicomonas haliclonae TaxID=1960125 RepID=A0A1X7AR22_9GAMM|nr:helix-turn-helix transcriptional regulator [Parendozoicomonas haliclonae]SMA50756.1 helix-turn-helix protein [Parendozoicomonas haliclonae]
MEVNAQNIKQLRQERAWTQQHLADACGLSLRTVQRAENYGNCSLDTLQALASVFEVEIVQLKLVPPPRPDNDSELPEVDQTLKYKVGGLVAAALILGFTGGYLAAAGAG